MGFKSTHTRKEEYKMKQKTKKMLKILSIILIILTLFEFVFTPRVSFASEESGGTSVLEAIGGITDGIVGIFLNWYNVLPLLIGGAIQGVATSVASIGGRTDMDF